MWWSAWSRNQTDMPVAGSSRRCSQARHSASRRLWLRRGATTPGTTCVACRPARGGTWARAARARTPRRTRRTAAAPARPPRARRRARARRPSRSLQPPPGRRRRQGAELRGGRGVVLAQRQPHLGGARPAIHGSVSASAGGAPEASTIARPLGRPARSATSRMRSRWPCRASWSARPWRARPMSSGLSKSPISCERSSRKSTSDDAAAVDLDRRGRPELAHAVAAPHFARPATRTAGWSSARCRGSRSG